MSSLFLGVVLATVVIILEMSGDPYYESLSKTLKLIFAIIPQFGLTFVSIQFCKQAVWNFNWNMKPSAHKLRDCYWHYNPCCSKLSG